MRRSNRRTRQDTCQREEKKSGEGQNSGVSTGRNRTNARRRCGTNARRRCRTTGGHSAIVQGGHAARGQGGHAVRGRNDQVDRGQNNNYDLASNTDDYKKTWNAIRSIVMKKKSVLPAGIRDRVKGTQLDHKVARSAFMDCARTNNWVNVQNLLVENPACLEAVNRILIYFSNKVSDYGRYKAIMKKLGFGFCQGRRKRLKLKPQLKVRDDGVLYSTDGQNVKNLILFAAIANPKNLKLGLINAIEIHKGDYDPSSSPVDNVSGIHEHKHHSDPVVTRAFSENTQALHHGTPFNLVDFFRQHCVELNLELQAYNNNLGQIYENSLGFESDNFVVIGVDTTSSKRKPIVLDLNKYDKERNVILRKPYPCHVNFRSNGNNSWSIQLNTPINSSSLRDITLDRTNRINIAPFRFLSDRRMNVNVCYSPMSQSSLSQLSIFSRNINTSEQRNRQLDTVNTAATAAFAAADAPVYAAAEMKARWP